METRDALRVIQSLADGVNPNTGELFSEDSPYQHPQIVRALFVAVGALQQLEDRQRRVQRLPEHAGKPWDDAEDKQLGESFDAGITVTQLARQHKRTEGAIQLRLEKLGKAPASRPARFKRSA